MFGTLIKLNTQNICTESETQYLIDLQSYNFSRKEKKMADERETKRFWSYV